MENSATVRFDAREKGDLVQRLDVTALMGGESLCALTTKPCESLGELKAYLRAGGVAYEQVGEHAQDNGGHTLVIKSAMDAQALAHALTQSSGAGFEQYKHEETWRDNVDMMKVRGVLGSIGQGMTFVSAMARAKNQPSAHKLFGYAVREPHYEMYSSGTSMIANAINFTYGVQKKQDKAGLYLTKKRINQALSGDAQGVLPDVTQTQYIDDTPQSVLGKLDKTLEENSTVAADGLKFAAKYVLTKNENDGWIRAAGFVSQAAKIVTFAGKAKPSQSDKQLADGAPYEQNMLLNSTEFLLQDVFGKQTVKRFIDPLREQAMPISGLGEFAATAFMGKSGYKGFAKARLAGDSTLMFWNSMKIMGTATILAGLLSKSFAPFSNRKVDQNELYAHIDAAMEQLPQGGREAHLPAVIDAMRQIPEFGDVSYTELYAGLLDHRKDKAQGKPETEVTPEMLVGQVAEPKQPAIA